MRNSALLAIAVLGFCLTVRSQVSSEITSSAKSLADGIQKGDIEAILQAGRWGDPSFVPQLVAYRRKAGGHINTHEARAIQLALAKLGQPAELREIRCEFLYGSASVQYDAVDKLQYVGGWFSIEAVTRVLDNPDYRGAREDGGGIYAPLGEYAVRPLPKIIPTPPEISIAPMVEGSSQDLERQRAWKDWIQTHKESLSKLAPSNAGVETSPQMCQKILKHDRTFDHSVTKPWKSKGKKGGVIVDQ